MARIRTVKPEFWSSPDVADVCRDARLLFIAIWNFADDKGRVEYIPAQLAASAFPFDDDVGGRDIEEWVGQLCDATVLVEYRKGRRRYLAVTGWDEHQRISNPSQPRCPDPDDDACQVVSDSADQADSVDPTSTLNGPSVGSTSTVDEPSAPERRSVGALERRSVGAWDPPGEDANATSGPPRPPPPDDTTSNPATDDPPDDDPPDTQQLIADHLDALPERPPKAVVGQTAKLTKQLLDEGIPAADVAGALALLRDKGKHPAILPSLVEEYRANGRNRLSHGDRYRQAAAELRQRRQADM